jgi:hypothetical protein
MPLNGVILIFTVMVMLFLVVGCTGATMAGNNSGVPNENSVVPPINTTIIFDITSPLEDDVSYYDIVPSYMTVRGKIYGTDTIRNVTVTYGNESADCGKKNGTYFDVSCKFLIHHTIHKITIDVIDNQGSVTSETRNFTYYLGQPPPGTIFVYGKVVDTDGNPVTGAVVIFETDVNNYGHFSVNTTTDKNGKFSMKKTFGYQQKITVKKAGYQTLIQDVTFKPYNNDINFTLSSQPTAPGFTFTVAVLAIVMMSMVSYLCRKRREQ